MSLQLIRTFHPVAHKDYTCCLCGFTIKKETSYVRRRCSYDGRIYDCVCHNECEKITRELDMFDNLGDEGLDGYTFCEIVFDAANDMGVFEASKTDHQLVLDILSKIDEQKANPHL